MKDFEVVYKGLEVEIERQKLTEEQLDTLIENRLKAKSVWNTVTGRTSALGDEIIFDYAGFMGEEQFPGGTAEKQSLVLGSNMFIPGFEEQCVGKTAGEEFDVNVTFPEQYAAPMLAGKPAVFKCKLHEIHEKTTPELTDEFAASDSPVSTASEYREYIKTEAQRMMDNQAQMEARNALMHKMMESVELEISKEVMDAELEVMMAELSDQLMLNGFSLEQYLEYSGKTEKMLRAEMMNDAVFRARLNITLEKISELENITVSQEELDEVIELAANEYGMSKEEVLSTIGEIGMESFKQDLLRQKTENFIMENCKVVFKD